MAKVFSEREVDLEDGYKIKSTGLGNRLITRGWGRRRYQGRLKYFWLAYLDAC